MATRRLVIVMLMLLGISTLAAALAPPRSERAASTSTTGSTTQATPLTPAGGELVRGTIDAQAKRPPRIRIGLGDQLSLEVRSTRVVQVEIARLGLTDSAAPLSPARFDLLAERQGSFEVRLQESRREIGVIEVRAG
ncbi:MAG: hypothetical protein ABI726_04430 [bacterium]